MKKRSGKKKKSGTISLGSFLRQKSVQQCLYSVARFLLFIILLIGTMAVLSVLIIIFSTYQRNDFMECLSFLLGIQSPKKDDALFVNELVVYLIGRLLIWGVFIPYMLKQYISPMNPIHFAGAVAIKSMGKCKKSDGDNYKLTFRYWIMKRRSDFLQDVQLIAYLQDTEKVNSEEESLPLFLWEDKLNMARGVRQWSCDIEDAAERAKEYLKDHFGKEVSHERFTPTGFLKLLNDHTTGSRYRIVFSIRGTDYSGKRFSKIKSYSLSKVIYGARFAQIRESEWNKKVSVKDERVKYQNFNKLVVENDIYLDKKKQIKCENQYQEQEDLEIRLISKEQERETDRLCIRFFNFICKKYYNEKRIKDWVEDRISKRSKVDFS